MVGKHRSEEDSQHQKRLKVEVEVALMPRDTQKKTVAAADPAGLGVMMVVGRLQEHQDNRQELKVALLLREEAVVVVVAAGLEVNRR